MKYIAVFWESLTNLGINDQFSHENKSKIKVCNQSLAVGLFSQILLLVSNILNNLPFLSGLGVILLVALMLYFNYIDKFQLTQLMINILFPFVLVLLGVLYGKNSGVQYNFLIFITTGVFFNQKLILKLLFILYNFALYIYLRYYWTNYESIYSDETAEFSQDVGFFSTAIIIILLIILFENQNNKYDDENQILLNSLEKNNTEIMKVNQELERFAYIASHDLKTPLRTILGYIKLIEKSLDTNNIKNIKKFFEEIKKGTLQMNDLIKSTLEYSRINNNIDIELTNINLNEVISSIKHAYINDESIEITSNQLPIIYSEEHQVFSLFQNLIENGIKYNKQSKKTIKINYQKKGNSHLIKITDNGIGIDKKYHNQIFTMFKRLHTKQQYDGTGLGLAICEKVVAKMNGKIWIESKVGVGTTFFIELPID